MTLESTIYIYINLFSSHGNFLSSVRYTEIWMEICAWVHEKEKIGENELDWEVKN